MYAKRIEIYGFKCFGKAEAEFRYPGEQLTEPNEHPNVNLILGDNGGGKSSVLRAISIAALAPALADGGFVPYRLVQRGRDGAPVERAFLKLLGALNLEELPDLRKSKSKRQRVPEGEQEFIAKLFPRVRGNDSLSLEGTPRTPVSDLIHDDLSPAFFVVGYGATRRVEAGGYSESSARKSRGRRYERVASMFEDHVALRPMQAWLPRLSTERLQESLALLNSAFPEGLSFDGQMDDDEYLFQFEGMPTPFPALSDGYKSFVGWVSDLVGQLNTVSTSRPLAELGGIVLVDEIDLHLHPSWQRDVVATLSRAFPRLQFIFTSHSPLVAASVRSDNVIVTGQADDGSAKLDRMVESLYGRGIESVLLSPYFGLESARPAGERAASQSLVSAATESRDGGGNEAEEFLRRLASPIEAMEQGTARSRGRKR